MSIKYPIRLRRAGVVVIVLFIALIGSYIVFHSHAASPSITAEAETGTLTNGAVSVTDSAASGNTAVKFTSPVDTGTSIEIYGAIGDGTTDNTAALAKAFSTAPADSTLIIPAGETFAHSKELNVTVPGLHITGSGTLLATNESDSAIQIKAPNVTIDGGMTLKFNTTGATRQQDGWQTMLYVYETTGTTIRDITIDGSPSAGISMYGASNYLIDGVTVQNTLADGIYNSYGSHDGVINNPTIRNPGDDGVSVVSYVGDGKQSYNIQVNSPHLYGQTHGRAFTVVGGHDITFSNVYADSSNSAALYFAAEPQYDTYGDNNIKVLGGTLINSNANSSVDQGAILIYNQQPNYQVSNVDIENVIIQDTRNTASRNVGILSNGGGGISGIQLRNITVTGGPANTFYTQTDTAAYNTIGWTKDGIKLPDHSGFTPFP